MKERERKKKQLKDEISRCSSRGSQNQEESIMDEDDKKERKHTHQSCEKNKELENELAEEVKEDE